MSQAFELPEAAAKTIESIDKKLDDAQAEIVKYTIKLQLPLFTERDEALKKVEKFWPNTLQNCVATAIYIDDEDREALDALTSIRVERNEKDPREASVTFEFNDNSFFSNKELTRSFKVKKDAPPLGSDDFDFTSDLESQPVKIDWKSEEKNLAKKNPTKLDDEDDEDEFQSGSFFSAFFETEKNELAAAIGDLFINELYPRAVDYYTGKVEEEYDDYFDDEDEEDEEDDEEDEEDEDDDDKEIDLEEEEKRPSKKTKKN